MGDRQKRESGIFCTSEPSYGKLNVAETGEVKPNVSGLTVA